MVENLNKKQFLTYDEQITFLEKQKGLIISDKEYARNLLEISMNHLQSRSFRLRVSLKKIMQCATII